MDAGDAPPSQLLSGETTTLSASPAATTSPLGTQDVSFVVGPDGQMIAVQKEPFIWKQFFIGFGVPGIFMVLPFILMAISGATALDDDWRNDEVTMTQTDGTNYSGILTLGEDRVVEECRAYELHTRTAEYFCDIDDDSRSRRIMMWVDGVTVSEQVGFWDSETGVLTFDDGADHGASFNMTMSSIDAEAWESDSGMVAGTWRASLAWAFLSLESAWRSSASPQAARRRASGLWWPWPPSPSSPSACSSSHSP
jgi:hypothetical protein